MYLRLLQRKYASFFSRARTDISVSVLMDFDFSTFDNRRVVMFIFITTGTSSVIAIVPQKYYTLICHLLRDSVVGLCTSSTTTRTRGRCSENRRHSIPSDSKVRLVKRVRQHARTRTREGLTQSSPLISCWCSFAHAMTLDRH